MIILTVKQEMLHNKNQSFKKSSFLFKGPLIFPLNRYSTTKIKVMALKQSTLRGRKL